MRKILYLLLCLPTLAFITSCQKDFICKCTQIYTEPAYVSSNTGEYHEGHQSISTVTNVFKAKKGEGESQCKASESFETYQSTYHFNGQGVTTQVVTCELQ